VSPPFPSLLRAVAYYRVSTDQQAERYGLESQRLACQQYAREHGYTLVHEYLEGDGQRGVSGGDINRPCLNRLLRDATQQPRPFERVLVYDTSRIARDDFTWLAGWVEAQLAGHGIRIEGQVPLSL
jgi:DNA invertase Pin-like site-specific DNA recombinase